MLDALELKAIGGIALVVALVVGFLHIESMGAAKYKAGVDAATAQSRIDAAAKEGAWNENARQLSKARNLADSATDARYAADLARLRARAASSANVPQGSASAVDSGSGSDGGFLERDRALLELGQRANRLRSFAAECAARLTQVAPAP